MRPGAAAGGGAGAGAGAVLAVTGYSADGCAPHATTLEERINKALAR